jgi:hypothetical protein
MKTQDFRMQEFVYNTNKIYLSIELSSQSCSANICIIPSPNFWEEFLHVKTIFADHSDRAVYGIYCIHLLERWDRGSNPTQGLDACVCI